MKRKPPLEHLKHGFGDRTPGRVAAWETYFMGYGRRVITVFRVSRTNPEELDDGRVYENVRDVWWDKLSEIFERDYWGKRKQ